MEIDWELKELGKREEGNYWDIASKYLLAFINTLESINKLIALHRLTPLLISEKNAALRK